MLRAGGTITFFALLFADACISPARACGIDVSGASAPLSVSGLGGDCVNVESTGSISTVSNDPFANATGIQINGDTFLTGVANAGTVSASNTGTLPLFRQPGSTGSATAVNVTDAVTATQFVGVSITNGIANSGSIIATTTANVPSVGIAIGDPRGFVCLTDGNDCGALQVFITISGGVTNTGTVTAQSSSGITSGVTISQIGRLQGGLSNTGSISANSNTVATGLVVNVGDFSGGLSNGGTISASAGVATGIQVGGGSFFTGVDQAILNSGRIAVQGTNGVGISVEGNESFVESGINNTGTITVQSVDRASVISGSLGATFMGPIMNGGTLIAATTGANSTASAITSGVGGNFTSSITNTGTIGAATTGSNGTAFAINLADTSTAYSITNTGTITASGASGAAIRLSGSILDFGGFVPGANVITNTGTIAGSMVAVDTTGTLDTTLNAEGGAIVGAVHMANSDSLIVSGGTIRGDVSGPATLVIDFPTGSVFAYANSISNVGTVRLASGTLFLAQGASITNTSAYTQLPAATLGFAAAPTTASPIISANTVNLAGTLQVVPLAGSYAASQTYHGIIASGSPPQGSFAAVTTTSPLFGASVTETANGVDLTLTHIAASALPGLSANESATGAAIEALAQGGTATQGLVGAFYGLDRNGIAAALDTLAPRASAQAMDAVHTLFSDISTTVETRLALAGNGLGEAGMTQNGIRIAQLDAPSGLIDGPSPWREWMRGFGGWGDASSTAAAVGFHEQRAGAILGVDKETGPSLILGGLAALGHTDLHLADGSGSTASDNYQAAFYGRYDPRPWYVDFSAGAGWSNNSETRNISFPGFAAATNGSYASESYSAYGEAGYAFSLGSATLRPLAGMRYSHLHSAGYTEIGGGAADLSVAPGDADSLASLLGARGETRVPLGDMVLVPHVSAIWQRELLSPAENVTAAFAAAPGAPFTTEGMQFGRDTGLVGVGISGATSERFTLSIDYELQLNRVLTEHAVSASLRFTF
jgi:uncharacterized protein with beta-barrel porin domain